MKHHSQKNPAGFALVATLSMMILLVVMAIGLLSLSTIELRRTSAGGPMERARANARFGLMIALGELQENLGPDQRVTAAARVAASGTPAHPHWLSVWRSTREDGTTWITRDGEKGGLTDQRQATGWDARDAHVAQVPRERRLRDIPATLEQQLAQIFLAADLARGNEFEDGVLAVGFAGRH